MHIPKTESGLSKHLLSKFQVDKSCNRKQVQAELKKKLLVKKVAMIRKLIFNLFLLLTFLTVTYIVLRLKLVLRKLCGRAFGKLYMSRKTILTGLKSQTFLCQLW